MTVKEYYDEYNQICKQIEYKYGIPHLVILAQGALETGWGKSVSGNNYFGIKAGGTWKGDVQEVRTFEYINGERVTRICRFRKYKDAQDSFVDYAELISGLSRYAKAFEANSDEEFIDAVAKGGYSTSPSYAQTVKKIINVLRECER